MKNKTFERNSVRYRVLAYSEAEKLMLLEDTSSEFGGTVSCLFDAVYKVGLLSASQSISYSVTKKDLFERASMCSKNHVRSIASFIREKYYKIPSAVCELISEAYCDENSAEENKYAG